MPEERASDEDIKELEKLELRSCEMRRGISTLYALKEEILESISHQRYVAAWNV
jgi:hypothetical protein